MPRRTPPNTRDHPIKLDSLCDGLAQAHSQVALDPELIRKALKRSRLSQEVFAARVGISSRSLRRFIAGAPLPAVVGRAIEAVTLVQDIQELIDRLSPGSKATLGQLRILHPSLAKPVRIKPPKPAPRPKKVKIAKPVRPKKRRGIGCGYFPLVEEPEDPGVRMLRMLRGLRMSRPD